MISCLFFLILLALSGTSNFFVCVNGQYALDFPSPMPLVIKSPYFNVWMASDSNLAMPGGRWPVFYSGPNVSWTGNIRVDGTGYIFQGENSNYTTAKTVGAYITPTSTIFTIDAGPVRLNLTYLSPIELNDWKLHSFPFAYMAIDLWSTDNQPHAVQLYSDVSGQFVSSNTSNSITWNTTQTSSGKSIYHRVQRSSPESLTERGDMSEDGQLYFATSAVTNLTWETGPFSTTRYGFLMNGTLNNTMDSNYRTISSNLPVMAFALNVGNVTSAGPIVFALGLVRDPVLTYVRALKVVQERKSLWWDKWSAVDIGIDDFLSNYTSALSRASTLDKKIMADVTGNLSLSSNTSALYQNLVALNVRQTIGAIEITTSTWANGTLAGLRDVRTFMKDVGNSRRANAVEVLYAAFPALIYLNPSLAGKLLEPLLEFQSTSALYSNGYAAPDLGSTWPQIQGNNTDQVTYAVDNCGSMLVMALAHASKSGDGWLIHDYYNLFRQWADYLVTNGLRPSGYLAMDQIAETSNIALKAVMGIYAMGKINKMLEVKGADHAKTAHYLDTATRYAKEWETLAFSNDHVMSTYGNTASWGLLYNLYLPRLFGANIFSEKIYDAQASWYAQKLATVDTFGLAYDQSDPTTAKAHWTLLTAGSVYNSSITSARDALIRTAEARPYFKNAANKPNPSTYRMDMGSTITGVSSPALGASFALLALTVPDQTTITLPSGTIEFQGNNPVRRDRILGGVLGTLGGLVLIGLVVFFVRRRRAGAHDDVMDFNKSMQTPLVSESVPSAVPISPYMSSGKSQLMNQREEAAGVSPSSDSVTSSRVGGTTPTAPDLGQQQQTRLVPQRPAHLHVTNLGPDDKLLLTSARTSSKLEPVRSRGQIQTQRDDDLRREVEQLRMEMDALRVEQQIQQPQMPEEPPPQYT